MQFGDILTFLHFRASWKLTSCLFLVALADFLFYHEMPGWTLGLFSFATIMASVAHNYRQIEKHPLPNIALCSSLIATAALVESPNTLSCFLCLLTVFAFALLIRNPYLDDCRKIILYSLKTTLLTGWQTLAKLYWFKRHIKYRNGKNVFIKYWLMPGSLSVVFVYLFAQANPVLKLWFSAINWALILDYLSLPRMLFWFSVATTCWAIIRPKFNVISKSLPLTIASHANSTLTSLLFNEHSIRTALMLFNALFALQNSMDIAILWNGALLPQGVSYAQYAHQGAYPLVFTALLAAVFVLIALRPGNATKQTTLIYSLVYIWVGQNIFLVISSITRLCGYIEEYSLTHLRLWALIWMGLVGLGLLLIIARIYLQRSNLWLINANCITLYSILGLTCFVNFGGIIADYNVRHCMEATGTGAQLDVNYLSRIGVEALPALQWFQTYHPYTNSMMVDNTANALQAKLSAVRQDWRQWTFRLYRLNRNLKHRPCTPNTPCEDDIQPNLW